MKIYLLRALLICFLVVASANATDPIPVSGFGIIGDSNSDEFQANDNRGGAYAATTLNWMEQLVLRQGLNFGPWGVWGGPRRTGYEYNWARSGATARSVVTSGQHTGLAQQISAGEVSHVFMYYGVNDFNPATSQYREIYDGSLSDAQVQTKINNFLTDTATVIDTLLNAGAVQIVMANLLSDYSFDAQLNVQYPSAAGRQRVSDAIKLLNTDLASLAASRDIVLADLEALATNYVQTIDQNGFAPVAGVNLNFNAPGNEPSFFSLLDGHVGTVFNGGPLANELFLNAMNSGYGLDIPLLSDQQVQENAGILPSPAPEILAFSATPPAIVPGTAVTLSWHVTSASRLSLNRGIGNIPMNGSVTVRPTTQTTYTLTATGPGGTSTAEVVVGLASVNTPPQGQNDTFSTDGTLSVNAPGVLANDTDSDGDSITASLVTESGNGQVALDPSGGFTYSPDAGFSGTDSFTYTANDLSSSSDPVTVTITVESSGGNGGGGSTSVVSNLDTWIVDGSYANQNAVFNVSPGEDRLVLVALSAENNRAGSISVSSVRLGNQALTEIVDFSVGNPNGYNNLHWVGYLPESQIAARNGDLLTVTYATVPSSPFDAPKIHYASYANVDQTAPIASFANTASTNTSSLQLSGALSADEGDRVIGFNVLGQPYTPGMNTAGFTQQTQSVGAANGHASSVFEFEATEAVTGNMVFSSSTRTRMAVSGIVLSAAERNIATNDIELDASFDGGSVGPYTITDNVIDLSLATDTVENSLEDYTYWVNFKLSNVDLRELTLNFDGVDTVPFLSYIGVEENQMVYRCDGEDWERLAQYSYNATNNGTYTVTQEFTCDVVQIATFFPYSYAQMQSMSSEADLSPWATRASLGSSRQGLDITLLTITDSSIPAADKKHAYIIGRQHASETASSYMLEGLVDFLVSDDAEAQTMRENVVWHIVPMTNPDGVSQGYSLVTSDFRDSDKDWGNSETLSVNIVREHLDSIDDTFGIDLFIDWQSALNDDRWSNVLYAPVDNTFFPILFSLTEFNEQDTTGTSCTAEDCSARAYSTQQRGLFSIELEPSPHLSGWTIDSLNKEGRNTAFVITEYFDISLDVDPPTPNPMTWAIPPASSGPFSVSMTASVATHTTPVEYFFVNTDGAGNNSGWQLSNVYEDIGLLPGTAYSYQVIARDQINQNETSASSTLSATTDTIVTSTDVITLDGWIVDGNYVIQDAEFSVSAGSDRVVLVALSAENNQAGSVSVNSVRLGNQVLTEITDFSVGNPNGYNNLHWVGYLPESQIAARNGDLLTISYGTVPSSPFDAPKIHYASYSNVDQIAPIASFATGVSTNTASLQLSQALSADSGDRVVAFNVLGQPYTPGMSTVEFVLQSRAIGAASGHASGVFEFAVSESVTGNPVFTSSTRTRMAVSAIVLNARQ